MTCGAPSPTLDDQAPRLRIAINADSLVTWWAEAVATICQQEGLLLDLVIEDQDVGLKRLRDGDVAACLCAASQPIAGARCVALGEMHYHPLASPLTWRGTSLMGPAMRLLKGTRHCLRPS
ncbi:hypothetical protein HORIV_13990 [Vreelandella olivaria]|uniref:LysR substrate-binding domain-containing protein n=1 Tax=Vreelandella olivaria TaxID=390919 RepID=A0ABM8HN55_9GAMM|nr:hypothetical protein HORIV_13990 [Halomonas olivaria]